MAGHFQRRYAGRHGAGAGASSGAAHRRQEFWRSDTEAARHSRVKLAAVARMRADGQPTSPPFDEERDDLAEMEHNRYVAERLLDGWRYGEPRDDLAKRHPSLIPWAGLTKSERDKDRAQIRDLEDKLLGRDDGPPPAPEPPNAAPTTREAAGTGETTGTGATDA